MHDKFSSLRELQLIGNYIGDRGARYIAKAFEGYRDFILGWHLCRAKLTQKALASKTESGTQIAKKLLRKVVTLLQSFQNSSLAFSMKKHRSFKSKCLFYSENLQAYPRQYHWLCQNITRAKAHVNVPVLPPYNQPTTTLSLEGKRREQVTSVRLRWAKTRVSKTDTRVSKRVFKNTSASK